MTTRYLTIILIIFLGVRLSEVNIFPKPAGELQLGDCILIGGEPANVTDINLNDDGSLTIIGKSVFTDEFTEKEANPEETIDVSTLNFTLYKVVKVDDDKNSILLKDDEENERDDIEVEEEKKKTIKELLGEQKNVTVEVAKCFDVEKIVRIF